MSVAAKIAGQSFAAIIVLSDIRKSVTKGKAKPEPCIAILDVFGDEDAARNYAQHTASKTYPKCDIDVVELYQWHFPENIDPDKVKDIYGHKRLNEIMTARKENQDLANDFESWCKENGLEPTYTDVEADRPLVLPEQTSQTDARLP